MDALTDDSDWQAAVRENTQEAYATYVERHHGSPHEKEAIRSGVVATIEAGDLVEARKQIAIALTAKLIRPTDARNFQRRMASVEAAQRHFQQERVRQEKEDAKRQERERRQQAEREEQEEEKRVKALEGEQLAFACLHILSQDGPLKVANTNLLLSGSGFPDTPLGRKCQHLEHAEVAAERAHAAECDRSPRCRCWRQCKKVSNTQQQLDWCAAQAGCEGRE